MRRKIAIAMALLSVVPAMGKSPEPLEPAPVEMKVPKADEIEFNNVQTREPPLAIPAPIKLP
jgi:hypothetical protein